MKILRVSMDKMCFKRIINADLIKQKYNRTNDMKKENQRPRIYKYGI
jgi:hypothetical protein